MTDEERKKLGGAAPAVQQPAQPAYQQQPAQQAGVLGGSDTDAQVAQAYQTVTGTPYKYNLDADATYQMYRDRYLQNAKRSMQDTMGQTAALTGGYGNTYSQFVGQQAYDETMRGLTDLIPQFEERAWNRRQQTYSQLSSSILQTGYKPSAEELQAAGMTPDQANSLFQAWIASNPAAAWMQGLMTAEQYYKLTGRQAPGAPGAKGPGGSGGGRGSGGRKTTTSKDKAYNLGELLDAAAAGMTSKQIEAGLRARGVDTSSAAVQQDIKWARSK